MFRHRVLLSKEEKKEIFSHSLLFKTNGHQGLITQQDIWGEDLQMADTYFFFLFKSCRVPLKIMNCQKLTSQEY